MLVYFLCAYYFGWTQQEIEQTDSYFIDAMLLMLPEWKKKTADMFGSK
jgi:hypothetical protein